jgi:hypothetical protein
MGNINLGDLDAKNGDLILGVSEKKKSNLSPIQRRSSISEILESWWFVSIVIVGVIVGGMAILGFARFVILGTVFTLGYRKIISLVNND